jgi:hypothetical protein
MACRRKNMEGNQQGALRRHILGCYMTHINEGTLKGIRYEYTE